MNDIMSEGLGGGNVGLVSGAMTKEARRAGIRIRYDIYPDNNTPCIRNIYLGMVQYF
jgi:hypothetical protein